MKKAIRYAASVLMLSLIISVLAISAAPMKAPAAPAAEPVISADKSDFRGLWVATVRNIDYPAKPTKDPEILKSEALSILEYAKNTGLNAVFLQVRPAADAIYKSKYFPWSKYLTGEQGIAPENGFDPLEFWVQEAHKRGIELHAWINPYRVTKREDNEAKHDFKSLDPANPAVLNPDRVVKHSDGNLYFDPGIPENRKLIIDGAMEIVENYDVDGIHFDDYFYPDIEFNDKATWTKYGAGYSSIDEWRRENVNKLISELSGSIKSTGKNIRFGISPFGIWANKKTNSLGSETNGLQSYYEHYADTRKWVKKGWIDYIAPQLYWNIGYSAADYSKLVTWWQDTVKDTGVDLYIGQAAYRAGSSDPSSPWCGVSEIEKQLKLNSKSPGVKGSIFFNYKSMLDNPALSAVIKAHYEQKDGIGANIPVNVSKPSENIHTGYDSFYLSGSADPGKPLYLNGAEQNLTAKGYFGVLVPLKYGANIFTFSQDASYSTRVIYRDSSKAPKAMSIIEIPKGSVFPQTQEYRMPGETVTLSCQAPIGAKVTVKFNGKSYTMKASDTNSYGSGAYPTKYSYSYTIPKYTGTPRNINLGTAVYTMTYRGKTKTCKSPANIGVIMKNSPFYLRVASEVIDTYEKPVSGNGAAFELYKGMVEYVTGMTGNYIRMPSGQWVKKDGVETYTSKSTLSASIKKAVYKTDEKWESMELDISAPVVTTANFDGIFLDLNISNTTVSIIPELPEYSIFSDISASKESNGVKYSLTLKEGQKLDGYYIEKSDKGIALKVKRPLASKDKNKPLKGISIMIDPGHGGTETGATGPLGMNYPEKTINLKTAIKLQTKLETLGANVIMTRTEDKTVSLVDRLAMSRKVKPDMFISLHANAMEDNVDMSKIDGFSIHYREKYSQNLASTVFKVIGENLNRSEKGIHVNNFYVTRGTWTPSILVESGFVTNPNEFEWLTDESAQAQLAGSISDAVVNYFSK